MIQGHKKKLKLVVLGYEFPHYKTENGIRELITNGHDISLVILQKFKKLCVPVSKTRVYIKQNPTGCVKELCDINNIKCIISNHDSEFTINTLKKIQPNIGIILGARILKKKTIDCFLYGIINLHPGDIPLNRGLDNFKWALVHQYPMIVTSHFISEKIDLGKIIMKSSVNIYKDDSIYDFSTRHFYNEFKVMINSLKYLQENHKLIDVVDKGNYFSALPDDIDKNIETYFNSYKKKFLI
jgi:folate-dependent phosphoribosylglycinamide formyltransferase PurN